MATQKDPKMFDGLEEGWYRSNHYNGGDCWIYIKESKAYAWTKTWPVFQTDYLNTPVGSKLDHSLRAPNEAWTTAAFWQLNRLELVELTNPRDWSEYLELL